MKTLGSRARRQPAPPPVVWRSLTDPGDPAARPWLELLTDEVPPRVLEAEEPRLLVWSSLWPDRPDDRVRFDITPDGGGSVLRWTLLSEGEEPTASRLGHLRFRMNVLVNERLRLSYGQ
ncbi:SRPBCC family protein [Phytomonospora endophytica]|uniref:SRPBCC family protein n=1 Tax=Phytomonospora endophytica TaxID=714109 RepID=A0A841FSY4_9ACTN|nr:hypothetical protein [Phytomonospora endophytica]MBB6035090.1 hypothetical protein [Phytomonospora endophytica]GIG64161.1 hypothetical protein Pen01_04560 [Phytomonospora endophytica]